MMRYGNAGGWMWAFGGVIVLGVLVLIVVAVWALVAVTKRPMLRSASHWSPVWIPPAAPGHGRSWTSDTHAVC